MENEIKDSRGDAERQVMSAENETHAAVVAEMRGTDNKCQFATKDGTGCYHCPFGSAASNCLFDKFADRAEAAHKREVAELRKQMGNAAKLREALQQAKVAILAARKKMGVDNPIILEIIDAALAAPARNCDMGSVKEQSLRHMNFCNQYPQEEGGCHACPCIGESIDECTLTWAQMPYEPEEGGNNVV